MTVLGKGPLDPFAWTRGLLLVNDIRLVDFLAEAGRYRQGWLGFDIRPLVKMQLLRKSLSYE